MAAPIKFGVGQSVLRKEDDALIRGKGRYTDDYAPQAALRCLVLRSPHAHAKYTVDATRARGLPGVALILTADDVGDLGNLPCLFNLETDPFTGPPYPILAKDEVRHVGDAIAFVVAETIDQARDAIEAIEVKWSPLPAVTGVVNAVKKGAALVWPDKPGNVLFDVSIGDKAATEAAFAKAHAVAEISIVNPRVVASFLETRAAVCEYDSKRDHLTLTVGSQGSHRLRDILCQNVLNIPTDKMRVICPDVGGGFGTKLFPYREYALMAVAARKLKKAVKWAADRSEHFMGDAQGRDNVTTAKMALAEDGKFLAMDCDLMGDMGAYLSTFGPYIPHGGAGMLPGLYDIQAFHCRVRTIFTHSVPVDAYRGAGRPEAAYVIERLVDACARKLDMTPDAIRRKNFIPPKALPYKTATGKVYDSGDFAAHLKRAMEIAEWKEFPKRAKAAKKGGLIRGIGLASYVEICGVMGEETANVRLDANGDVTVLIGTQSSGQGHQTAYAQIVAEQFGVAPERVHVRQGDTDEIATGLGTGGSASIPSGGVSVERATRELGSRLKEIAAQALEASAGDLEISEGVVRIAGTDRSISFADLAKRPGVDPSKLNGSATFASADGTYPNGTHVAEVEIDPATGIIKIVNYVIVDDFGKTLNPLLLAGQVHGGAMQGIGQALMEQVVYGPTDGQLITATFMDYALPRAADGPAFVFETHNVPCKTNPMGVKGAGEAGAIGSCPAVVNAIVDALWREYKIDHIDMPATPERVWVAISEHHRRHSL
ncbi:MULTISPECIES: xanthine dehydrogenase family protein molybdopterin-binding subunit [unclassified Bradyrhizobium]|uniref:xanthine dehydrogenase family protein molybdopterin-binding subunit n=1 Tax=unclassified Bradyrhizobium TaxID=2631580 RepID=UPI001CD20BC2|nr:MULTISPECIES: xanthine dehydrogenase family protein molybdopterin-binding subunit [unclassified Bradyrhizobium]MCA1365471.1 xanthine dehydrogenase family protein molybdopterin-binding subunit [Bradyrhizobium sp. IC4059]MCA1375142.1 xanthine dehydrogenase family protein molybdopterin-binding subunit [Bradyrhizobium sp. IC4060]MCA1471316.1 xanthine dehydrogenase family protein molybdopterin-binding subunit [Bradyrhizobium sp. IC3195]MCA1486055.1 xanthine dehydrogenase family protein molybdopte